MHLPEDNSTYLNNVYTALWPSEHTKNPVINYAIIDGASNKALVPLLKKSKLRNNCLYDGKLSYDLHHAAPYLVRLDPDNDDTFALLSLSLKNNGCILLKTFAPTIMLSILRIARRNHKIISPAHNTLIFRYFDPRIMRAYLPSCTLAEANHFLGPIDEVICAGEQTDSVHRFTRTDHGIIDIHKIDIQAKKIKKMAYNKRLDNLDPLTIRAEQLSLMAKSKLPAFFRRVIEYVIEEFPDFASTKKESLMPWVEQTYYQAREYGINTERDHYKFINYKCIFGSDFIASYDFAQPIMQAKILPGLKLSRLKDAFMEHLNS